MYEKVRQHAHTFLEGLLSALNIPGQVTDQQRTRGALPEIALTIQASEHADILIGKDGQTLDAIEHLMRVSCMKQEVARCAVSVDVNGYRKGRLDGILAVARQTAERVRTTGHAETLSPMSASERREVHTVLADYQDIETESIGVEPMRRIVVKKVGTATTS